MTKVKSVPFSQVKQKLLNTPEAVKGGTAEFGKNRTLS